MTKHMSKMGGKRRPPRRAVETLVVAGLCALVAAAGFWVAYSGRLEVWLAERGWMSSFEEAQQVAQPSSSPQQAARDGLATYTWAELSDISRQIEAVGPDGALAAAQHFGLANADGTLSSALRVVTLSDGTQFGVRLVGLLQDERADGRGPVGLSFLAAECVGHRPMRADGSAQGGWPGSDLRAWIEQELAPALPAELADYLVPVAKRSNQTGRVEDLALVDVASVAPSAELLWVPSAVEVCGPVSWFADAYGPNHARLDELVNAEGAQYQLFAQGGVTAREDPAGLCARSWQGVPCGWWYRTPYVLLSDAYYGALDSGYPAGTFEAGDAQGVVVGFCL